MFRSLCRVSLGIFASIAFSAIPSAVAADLLQSKDIVAVCGDSITEQKDYSVDIETYLLACREQGPVRSAQFGWSGDSMGWLWGRGGPRDILAIHPTVITTCYGMNDGGYKPITDETINNYRNGMTRLVRNLKENGVRLIVVGSPGCVDANTWRNKPEDAAMYNKTLATLRDIARDIAKENDCIFANVHDTMVDAMTKAKAKYGPTYHVAGSDGVHPWGNGHLVMAYAFLKALGCDGNIGAITVDMGANKATATEGHKVLSANDGAIEIESSRYPYCFSGDPKNPGATSGIIEFFPFNQDLNRFQLVVTNAPADRVRVTWGKTSREFPAADLAKGINLAAEFLDNPFSEPFNSVRNAVRAKQEYETQLYKGYLVNLAGMAKDVGEIDPKAAGGIDPIKAALVKKDANLAADVAQRVTPVKHMIKIEAVK